MEEMRKKTKEMMITLIDNEIGAESGLSHQCPWNREPLALPNFNSHTPLSARKPARSQHSMTIRGTWAMPPSFCLRLGAQRQQHVKSGPDQI
ncbi:hypothetical protein Ancab_007489 [Ancistrocladus abbreviatus]